MTKEEIKRKLNSYTKEQLIVALSGVLCFSRYEHIFYEIQSKIDQSIYFNENNLIDAAQENWEKASDEKLKYFRSLADKYGKEIIKFSELTPTEYDKYLRLVNAEQKAWEHLETLQDKQEKRLKKK